MEQTKFLPVRHIRSLLKSDAWLNLLRQDGTELEGIRGIAGVWENEELHGHEMGVDLIEMEAGRRFNLHIHPGAHILVILGEKVVVHIEGTDHLLVEGDSIFIPANYPHGVRNDFEGSVKTKFLAFGYPHMPIDSHLRMTEVADY